MCCEMWHLSTKGFCSLLYLIAVKKKSFSRLLQLQATVLSQQWEDNICLAWGTTDRIMDIPLALTLFMTHGGRRQLANASVVTINSLTTLQLLIHEVFMSTYWWQVPMLALEIPQWGKESRDPSTESFQTVNWTSIFSHWAITGFPSRSWSPSHNRRARWPAKPRGGWDLLCTRTFLKGLRSLPLPPRD